MAPGDAEECWARVQEALRARIVPEQFETWFLQARLSVADGPENGLDVTLAVLNTYTCDWISKYYSPAVESAVRSVLGQRCRVRITVDPEATVPPAPPTHGPASPKRAPESDPVRPGARRRGRKSGPRGWPALEQRRGPEPQVHV
jgi:chromosomal replication initiation ATPase DnaA